MQRLTTDHLASMLEPGESLHPMGPRRLALLRTADVERTEQRCRRLLIELQRPLVSMRGRGVVPAVAIGVVRVDGGMPLSRVQRLAHAALELAGRDGQVTRVQPWHVLDDHLRRRAQLRLDLPMALSSQAIDLQFEPRICLHTGAVIGARARPCWHHPRRGPVGEDEIRSLAQEAGRLDELERILLGRALEGVDRILSEGLRLAVSHSVSASALAEPYFAERLRNASRQSGVPTDLLHLELCPEGPWTDQGLLRQGLREVDAIGIDLVIRDVNRWHLPVSHLLGLRLAALECGMDWVRELAGEPRARGALGALVRVGHALGGRVGAEGVDSPHDLTRLRELRFDHARGPACAPELSLPDLLALVRSRDNGGSRIDPLSI